MTISILRRLPTQQVARPVSRACSHGELLELLFSHVEYTLGSKSAAVRAMKYVNLAAIDTDDAVLTERDHNGLVAATFYAFSEQ